MMRRSATLSRQLCRHETPKGKLDDEKVREIRRRYEAAAKPFESLAAAFGVSQKLMLNVGKRRTWRHVY
jgi:hypothetical protein